MTGRTGILAAMDGQTINDTPVAYRSGRGHLMIDSRPEMQNLGVYEGKCGVSVLNVANGQKKEEVFFTVPHHLPFIPKVSAYMYVRDAPATALSLVNKYAGSVIYAFGFPYDEVIFLRVGVKDISLVRSASNSSATAYNSVLQDLKIRAKYMVFSNEAAGEPYDVGVAFL